MEAVCVLAKHYSLGQKPEQMLSMILSELAVNPVPAAELFYLLGEYYEALGKLQDAVIWYKKAVNISIFITL